MKTQVLKLTALLLIMAGIFVSCNKDDDKKSNDPVNVPFKEYTLSETSCQWENLTCDDKLIVINSMEVLANYINCSKAAYPEIDFSAYTLLLVSGAADYGINKLTKNLQQLSPAQVRMGN